MISPATQPDIDLLEDRLRVVFEETPSLFVNALGDAVEIPDEEIDGTMFEDNASLRIPRSPMLSSIL